MAIASLLLSPAKTGAEELTFRIVATSDMHGCFFPYDYINKCEMPGSLSRVSTRVKQLRDSLGEDRVILLDNGDILQGQPTAYYYNYISDVTPHPVARMIDYVGYDAQTIGNHDVETGHGVYDRYCKDLKDIPLLAANAINKSIGEPYFTPYTILEKSGVKFAVLGLITPAIPAWLPENLREGIEFEDMVISASKWIEIIREKDKPDFIVGLFHSGLDSTTTTGKWRENASMLVAENVRGFDIIISGHDHKKFSNASDRQSDSPIVLNPANNAMNSAEVEINVKRVNGEIVGKTIKGEIVDISNLEPDQNFIRKFSAENQEVKDFVDRIIGRSAGELSVRDAYFGPSAFMQLLHDLQLAISGAEISFAAPLSFDSTIKEGDLSVSDMFKLYKYENMLYTMNLTGKEIKGYLEYSYSKWIDTMDSPEDHLILFSKDSSSAAKGDYNLLLYPAYNFDSASGINYTVNVTKPVGQRVEIQSMAYGTPFDLNKFYTVAVNSYRGNGGGDLLTKGAGIRQDSLSQRVVKSTDRDLRYYLIKEIEKRGTISPKVNYNWRFIPEGIAREAISRDRRYLFGD